MDDIMTIPLSYIAQYNYCKRRAGLLMNEQLWNESSDTAMGRYEHERVHTSSKENKSDCVLVTDMPVFSEKMGLYGKCDAVEMNENANGCVIPFLDNEKYIPYPIEYKHGVVRNEIEYELQLCAQAMCIEEMFGCIIDKGAIFYITSHRRHEVLFDEEKRKAVYETAKSLWVLSNSQAVPNAVFSSKCRKCSLYNICMPNTEKSAQKYLAQIHKSFEEE